MDRRPKTLLPTILAAVAVGSSSSIFRVAAFTDPSFRNNAILFPAGSFGSSATAVVVGKGPSFPSSDTSRRTSMSIRTSIRMSIRMSMSMSSTSISKTDDDTNKNPSSFLTDVMGKLFPNKTKTTTVSSKDVRPVEEGKEIVKSFLRNLNDPPPPSSSSSVYWTELIRTHFHEDVRYVDTDYYHKDPVRNLMDLERFVLLFATDNGLLGGGGKVVREGRRAIVVVDDMAASSTPSKSEDGEDSDESVVNAVYPS